MLGLVVATAFGAHGFARYQAEGRQLRMRDYSSAEKWVEPKYASIADMEEVSRIRENRARGFCFIGCFWPTGGNGFGLAF